MSNTYGPSIVTSGLQIYLDAANVKSYPGSGTNWIDTFSGCQFNSSVYTYPSLGSSGPNKYFTFINNGTTSNNILCSNVIPSVYNQRIYTRSGWFYLSGYSSSWSPIICNQIGNNTNMALIVSAGGNLGFYQYDNTQSGGTAAGDYGVYGSVTISTGLWYMGTIVVNLALNSVSFYVNGVLDTTQTLNTIGNSNSNNILVGGAYSDSYSGGRMFKGNIASVSHYNRLLSASEILQNFNAQRKRFGV